MSYHFSVLDFQLLKALQNTSKHLKSKLRLFYIVLSFLCYFYGVFICDFYAAVVSFGKITHEQKDAVEKLGMMMYGWDDFLQLVGGHILMLENVLIFCPRTT